MWWLWGRVLNVTFPVGVHFQAIWMMDPKDVGQWQHEEFYRYIAQAHDKPRYTLHYKTDAPLNIRSIFYVPEMVSSACWGSLSGGVTRSTS